MKRQDLKFMVSLCWRDRVTVFQVAPYIRALAHRITHARKPQNRPIDTPTMKPSKNALCFAYLTRLSIASCGIILSPVENVLRCITHKDYYRISNICQQGFYGRKTISGNCTSDTPAYARRPHYSRGEPRRGNTQNHSLARDQKAEAKEGCKKGLTDLVALCNNGTSTTQ